MQLRSDISRRERQILEVIYRLGEASANDIMVSLPENPSNATVRTQLRILEAKGIVKHRRDGKKFLFRPSVNRKAAAKSALRSVLATFFGGSVEDALATHLADPKANLDAKQIQRLRKLIDEYEAQG